MPRGGKPFQFKNRGIRKPERSQSIRVKDLLFELKYVKNLEDRAILENRDQYPDFWKAWEIWNKHHVTLEDLKTEDGEEFALRTLRSIGKEFYKVKRYIRMKEDIKRMRMMGAKPIDAVNQIVYSDTKQEVITDENNREISRSTKTEIVAKKIERIEFVSEVTIKSMQNILASQDMAEDWMKDYKEAIDCAREGKTYKGKYRFYHLELAAKYNRVALDLADRFEDIIMTGTDEEITDANKKINAANKLHTMMTNVMNSEMQVLRTMKAFHEGGEARQRELMGAINTDRQLIEMGNAVVKEEREVVDRTKLREKLKEHGYSKIQDILAEELKNVGAISDDEEEIIEAEDEII